MKKVAGTLKLDQAQFRELEAFSKFGSDLDAATLAVLEKGRRNVEILKQPQYAPYRVEQQIAILYCGTHNLMKDVPLNRVREFEKEFIEKRTGCCLRCIRHFVERHNQRPNNCGN